jgi:hypothetical protein
MPHAHASVDTRLQQKEKPPDRSGGFQTKKVLFLVLVATVSATISTVSAAIAATVTTTIVATAVSTTVTTAAAATVSTAAAAVSAAVSATVASTAFGAGTSLVHNEVTAMERLAVGAFDAGTSAFVVGHFHETEAAATVGGLVHNDLGRGHFAESCKKLLEVLVLYGVRNVGDVNVHEVYY